MPAEIEYYSDNVEPLSLSDINDSCVFCWKANTCSWYGCLTNESVCPLDHDPDEDREEEEGQIKAMIGGN